MKLNIRATDFDNCFIEFGHKYTGQVETFHRVPVHGIAHYPINRDYRYSGIYRDDKFVESPSSTICEKVLDIIEAEVKLWIQANPEEMKKAGLARLNDKVNSAKAELLELAHKAAAKENEIEKLQQQITLRS